MSIREIRPSVWDVHVYGDRRADGSYQRSTRRIRGGVREARKVERELLTDLKKRSWAGSLGRHPLLKDYALDWLDGKTDIEPQTRKNYKGLSTATSCPTLGASSSPT